MILNKNYVRVLLYGLFIAAIMSMPLFLDEFWLNRIAKYLVFGMLGIAISCRGATPAS